MVATADGDAPISGRGVVGTAGCSRTFGLRAEEPAATLRYLQACLRCAARLETHWPLKGSTWQSVVRARPTEIEYLNGEIVRLGRQLGVATPLNEVGVALERRRAAQGRFLTAHEIERAVAQRGRTQEDAAALHAGR